MLVVVAITDANGERRGALPVRHHEREATRAADSLGPVDRFVWGASGSMRELRDRITAVASTRSVILLVGETGTGKGAIARAIHDRSAARSEPFVHFDCAGVPPSLIESALFGHERGAFTGAHARRIGRAEAAGVGTLFLDEIGEVELVAQARLLRLLQDQCFERVGGGSTLRLTARVVAATNRDLASAVCDGSFRADLFHRIAVVALRVPPVRERRADIPLLLACAAERARIRTGAPTVRIDPAALHELIVYAWPGNVREMMNVMERAAACWPGRVIDRELVSRLLESTSALGRARDRREGPSIDRSEDDPRGTAELAAVLDACGGNVSRAARALGVPRSTLRYRLQVVRRPAPRSGDAPHPCLPGFETYASSRPGPPDRRMAIVSSSVAAPLRSGRSRSDAARSTSGQSDR